MSWHYLQEGAEVFSVEAYLAGLRSARVKLNPTPAMSSSSVNEMASSPTSPSGTMCAPLTARHGEGLLMLSAEDSLARTSPVLAKGQASPAPAPAYGARCTVSYAKYDRGTCSWRIHPCLFAEDSPLYSGTWPKLGMMLRGVCWELPTSVLPTNATESGFSQKIWCGTPTAAMRPRSSRFKEGRTPNPAEWAMMEMLPTPTCQDAKNNGSKSQMERNTPPLNAVAGGALNPEWVEWLMGWPIGWTDLRPLGMDRCRWWQQSLLKDLNNFC